MTEFLDETLDGDDFFDFEPQTYTEWTTKDGRIIPVTQMSVSHIKNCIRMLENDKPAFPCMFTENAQESAEIEYNNFIEHIDTWIEVFENELKSREGKNE